MEMTMESENFGVCDAVLPIREVVLADNFTQALSMLGADNSFVYFDLGLTVEEKAILNQLDVNTTERYEHEFDSNFSVSYTDYLKNIGNDEILSSSVSSVLEKIVQNTQTLSSKSPFIFGYATTPEVLNFPLNWHVDQKDTVYDNLSYRVSIAIKGEGTMFCKLAEDKQKQIDAINTLNEIRSILDNNSQDENTLVEALNRAPNPCAIEDGHLISQAPSYFGTVFVIGKTDFSAIHTAPIVTDKRIFFSFGL
jgi:hypothetical protein